MAELHYDPLRKQIYDRSQNINRRRYISTTIRSHFREMCRAVVLESSFGLESGLKTFFYRLGLVLDSLVFVGKWVM